MSRRLLTDLRLFSGVDGEVLPDGAVLVDGGVIAYAGPAADLPTVDGDVQRTELGGRFVMPGMTESHIHLSYANAHP